MLAHNPTTIALRPRRLQTVVRCPLGCLRAASAGTASLAERDAQSRVKPQGAAYRLARTQCTRKLERWRNYPARCEREAQPSPKRHPGQMCWIWVSVHAVLLACYFEMSRHTEPAPAPERATSDYAACDARLTSLEKRAFPSALEDAREESIAYAEPATQGRVDAERCACARARIAARAAGADPGQRGTPQPDRAPERGGVRHYHVAGDGWL